MPIIVESLNRADKATAKRLAALGDAERQKLLAIANRAHSGGAALGELDMEMVVRCSTPEELTEVARRCRDIAALFSKYAERLEASRRPSGTPAGRVTGGAGGG